MFLNLNSQVRQTFKHKPQLTTSCISIYQRHMYQHSFFISTPQELLPAWQVLHISHVKWIPLS